MLLYTCFELHISFLPVEMFAYAFVSRRAFEHLGRPSNTSYFNGQAVWLDR